MQGTGVLAVGLVQDCWKISVFNIVQSVSFHIFIIQLHTVIAIHKIHDVISAFGLEVVNSFNQIPSLFNILSNNLHKSQT